MKIDEFQNLMKTLYFHQDLKRGYQKSFIWLIEEIGELASILHMDIPDKNKIKEEIADIFAWICSLANLLDIKVEEAVKEKYPGKCIKCSSNPCRCDKLKNAL